MEAACYFDVHFLKQNNKQFVLVSNLIDFHSMIHITIIFDLDC